MSAPTNSRYAGHRALLRLSALAVMAALFGQAQAASNTSLQDLLADSTALAEAEAAQRKAAAKPAPAPAPKPAAKPALATLAAPVPKPAPLPAEAVVMPARPAQPVPALPSVVAAPAPSAPQTPLPLPPGETFAVLPGEKSQTLAPRRVAAAPSAAKSSLSVLIGAAPPAPMPEPAPPMPAAPAALPAQPSTLAARRPDKTAPASQPITEQSLDPNARTGLVAVAPVRAWAPTEGLPVPDRWRLVNDLALLKENPLDPYNQNTLKGDKPIRGDDEFLNVSVIADSIWEPRRVPTPVGAQSTTVPGSNDIFGGDVQQVYATNIIVPLIYIKGDTAFRPPDYELHFTPVFNFNGVQVEENRALRIDPRESRTRRETFIGVQELFVDYHLRNVSDRFDFDSIRVGIQPIALDFRGFLFQDLPMSVRLFGNRDNNFWQYNLLWARRLEKDTNSLLNSINQALRDDDVFAFNLYRQDWPVVGFVSQGIVAHNINREGQDIYYNRNGVIERPGSFGLEKGRNYQVTYFGLNGDGHFGRTNLTASAYLALGRESKGVFTEKSRQITAGFAAAELSWDFDWTRLRISGLYATGDNDPFDGSANGFDSINELPLIGGADTSYKIRQSIPLIGGGGVSLNTRNGVLNNLRTSIQHGQSNFANPGTVLVGVGTDFDITPTFRVSTNVNHVRFADSTVVEVARNQGNISEDLGFDVSVATIWRPFATQNIVVRVSYAELLPGEGYKALFPDQRGYSFLANLIFTY